MHKLLTFCILILISFWTLAANGQDRYIEFKIISAGGELGLNQQVVEELSEVGADRISLKSSRGAMRPDITESESGGTVFIELVGVLDGRQIKLPGKTFSFRDKAGISDYIQKLRDDGSKLALADKKAFGLTSEQLVSVYEQLGKEVGIETKGQPSSAVIKAFARNLESEVIITDAARELFNDTPVLEEYFGLSVGTTMAGILRPLGLVVAPFREQGQELQIMIAASGELDEHWPIGWPIEEPPVTAEPKLFKKLDDVNITQFVLQDALNVIQSRVEVPFLFDQNGMARGGIELDQIKVTLVHDRKMAYYTVLRKILVQTKPKLGLELRQDENGVPFLWISPQN